MSDEFSEIEIAGSKWHILKILSKNPQTPKQLADKLGTTVANMSQQLKLLEAYGFLKKTRTDKGPEGRKNKDLRVTYALVKERTWLTHIGQNSVRKKEIKMDTNNGFLINLLLLDLKDDSPILMAFFVNHAVIEFIDSAYYLDSKNNEIHLLIITNKLDHFRENKSTMKFKYKGDEKTIRFWSHSVTEIKEGLARKEAYFENLISQAIPLFERERVDLYNL